MSSEDISALDPSNKALFSDTLNSVKGQKIEAVYYCIANYQERAYGYDGFHLCDRAILLKLANGSWLNWVWIEYGFYQSEEINICTIDIREKLMDGHTEVKNVSESDEWRQLIGKEIQSVQFKTAQIDGNAHISDLKLTFENAQVTICAIDEPDHDLLPELVGLPYSPNWTIAVFDDSILKKHRRMN